MANGSRFDPELLKNLNYSQDYLELVVQYYTAPEAFIEEYEEYYPEILNSRYAILHLLATGLNPQVTLENTNYSFVPKLYTLLDTTSIEAAGVLRTQNQPILNLTGRDVMIGFIDTGIEYTHPAFRLIDGRSRIAKIWDQTIEEGPPPSNFSFGTEYTREQLDEALASDEPLSIVPSTDTNGHGTFIAGVAAGTPDAANNFVGAAPGSDIVVVKLKEAKDYLKGFFLVNENALAYQETDIMQGLLYLVQAANEAQMPIIICLALGSNQGDHAGNAPLPMMIDEVTSLATISCVIASGNEAAKAHHYYGVVAGEDQYDDVEILVSSNQSSFTAELWAQAPELYSVAIRSPIGETIYRIPPRLEESQIISFVLEETVIFIDYEVIEKRSGSQVIMMRFLKPTPGIWTVQVYCENYVNGIFNMWLPITGFTDPDVVFLKPNPDITITVPSSARNAITVSGYNVTNNSIYINSSRGYSRTGFIKPDITAPAVNVYGPALNGGYTSRTGTSAAAAITAGAAALIQNWGVASSNRFYSNGEIKNFFIRGANRNPNLLYPNREWGYGTLDVYQVFRRIT